MCDAPIDRMSTPITVQRARIVVALDRSEYAEIVLEHAIDQAARHDHCDVHFITVVEDDALVDQTHADLAALVHDGMESLTMRADCTPFLYVVAGNPEEEIAVLATDLRADLLVIGRFGVHEKRGSTAERVLTRVTCPTLVVALKDDDLIDDLQCPDCVVVRAKSNGEQLFCAAHTSGGEIHLSDQTSWFSSWRGGSIW